MGDRNVIISMPDLHRVQDRTPVLIDDIVSSAQTMLQATQLLRNRIPKPAICIAVHALFAQEGFAELSTLAGMVVTSNTLQHKSNGIDVSGPIADAAIHFIRSPASVREQRPPAATSMPPQARR